MKTLKQIKNKWAKNLTQAEVSNWVQSQVEIGRIESTGYWTSQFMVRCPFNQPLAIIGQ